MYWYDLISLYSISYKYDHKLLCNEHVWQFNTFILKRSKSLAMTPHSVWWRHQIETFSVLLAICAGNSSVTDEFPTQRPGTRGFDVFFDLRLNERLNK